MRVLGGPEHRLHAAGPIVPENSQANLKILKHFQEVEACHHEQYWL